MYRIELAPGEETVFRTIEELAVAVRNGLVTPRCRIYHSASQKWLPIEFHPHYKKALSLPAARVAEAAAPRSGHPPRLETLSFAVAPAARPAAEPLPESAPESAAETRPDSHPAQAPPQAERPAQEPSVTKRPAGEHRVGHQGDAERQGAERSGAKPATQHSATQHSAVQHSATQPSATQHRGTEHPATQHPAPQHPASEDAATTHSAVLHTAADEIAAQAAEEHPVVEPPAAEDSPTEHPVTESPYRAHPEPTPAPKSKSSYRPDSYLPPSVRVIADDPYVAIAPEPAIAPPVTAGTRRSWSMMPAVEETPALPTISYPEITPAEEPVAERTSSSRGHRRLQVAVAILVLAAGGYLARSFYSPVRASHAGSDSSAPAAALADRPALPEGAVPAVPTAVTKPSPARPPVVTPTAPASSGFAAALEPRAMASGPAPIFPARAAAAQQPPVVSAADSTAVAAAIAPPLAEMQMDLAALPGGDSLVAQPRSSDSAMKRILRAVNGGKDPR